MSEFRKVGVVGAGNMGSGIVQKLAQEGFTVVMHDVQSEFVARGRARIRALLGEAVSRKLFTDAQVEDTLARIYDTTDLGELADCDYIIEAIYEDEVAKKELFAALDGICKPETILATNTSSFYVSSLADATKRPDRVVGLHFFFHPAKNRLVEVVPGARTSQATVDASYRLAKKMGKSPIGCKDAPGFVVNRFFAPWLNEAVRLLEEGVADIATIEAAAKKTFRIGMGPFELMNVTGLPIEYHTEVTLGRELGRFYSVSPLLKAQIDLGENWDLAGEPDESKFKAVGDHLLGVTFQVVGEILDEGVSAVEDTDAGAKLGLRWAMGPFQLMNLKGIEKAVGLAEAFCRKRGASLSKSLEAQRAAGKPWPIRMVDLAVEDGIAWITVNRPEALNALNEAVVEQLGATFEAAAARADVKALVIQGAGKAFIAGADIKFFIDNIEAGTIPKVVEFTRGGQQLLRRLETCPKPVVAKVDGLALGGGFELAMACTAIVATEKALFGLPETGIGIYPGLGGSQRTPRLAGKALGKYLVFTGQTLDGKTAHEIGIAGYFAPSNEADGFVKKLLASGPLPDKYAPKQVPETWQAVADAFSDAHIAELLAGKAPNADPRVEKAVKAIGKKAPLALKTVNKIMDEGMTRDVGAAVELELDHIPEIFATKDALHGLKSIGVYQPQFTGE